MGFKRLSGLDTAFLAAEAPANWLHVMAILFLDPDTVPGGYSFERFRGYLAARLHLIPPLRRRLRELPFGFANPIWVEGDVDLDRHLRRITLPAPGGRAALADLAARTMEQPLDRKHPLWEITVVEGVEGGQVALLAKLHHSMMDGMAGMQYMAALLSREPDVSSPDRPQAAMAPRGPAEWRVLVDSALFRLGRPWRLTRALGGVLTRYVTHRLGIQSQSADGEAPVGVARTWLNAPSKPERSVAFVSLPLHEVRAIARVHDATINDVVLAVVGGALRLELGARAAPPSHPLVAAVPVSMHEEGDEAANAVSVMYVGLATDVANATERLRAVRDGARRAKLRQRSLVGEGMTAIADALLPYETSFLFRVTRDLGLLHRLPPLCNLLVSNVPGPPVPLYLGGARLLGIHPLGPIYDGLALNVTVLGREDRSLDFGIVALGGLLDDPFRLADAMTAALADLREESSDDRVAGRPG